MAISPSLSCIFSGTLKCSVFWAIFFFFNGLGASVTLRGGDLGVPGRGNAGRCIVMLYVGEGLRGSHGALSSGFPSFTPIPTIKLGHSGAGS